MLFAAIFSLAQRACNFHTSAVRNVTVGSAIACDRLRLYGDNSLCDRLRSAIRDRLLSYGNQPLRLQTKASKMSEMERCD